MNCLSENKYPANPMLHALSLFCPLNRIFYGYPGYPHFFEDRHIFVDSNPHVQAVIGPTLAPVFTVPPALWKR